MNGCCILFKIRARLGKLISNENGWTKRKTVLAIAGGLILAGFLVEFLTRGRYDDEGHGVISYTISVVYDVIRCDIINARYDRIEVSPYPPAFLPA